MKKNKNKDKKDRLSASTRLNRNELFLWIAGKNFQGNLEGIRAKFALPLNGFRTRSEIAVWHKWLCADIENRFKPFQEALALIMHANDLHEGFYDAVKFCVVWDRDVWPQGFPEKKIGTNYRIFSKYIAGDEPSRRTIFVEFLGPVSKEEILGMRKEINEIMTSTTKVDWGKMLTSKQNLQQSFEDHRRYTMLDTNFDDKGRPYKRTVRCLIDDPENISEKDSHREVEAKRKSLRKFGQKLQKKK